MISGKYFTDLLTANGVDLITGVPCSYFSDVINYILSAEGVNYVPASSEGEAVAFASGYWLSGKMSAILCQNSGLGNMLNPLTSLSEPFGIPSLVFVSHRGQPGLRDESQHKLMGEITEELISLMRINWSVLPSDEDECEQSMQKAIEYMRREQRPYVFVVKRNTFEEFKIDNTERSDLPSRYSVLELIAKSVPEDASIIATTGMTGRELYTIADRPLNLYCVGSMGYANSLANGLAFGVGDKPVYVIDGDGAAIMHLGNLVTISYTARENIIHFLLDNGTYDSTGGQYTTSSKMSFGGVAEAVSYREVFVCNNLSELGEVLSKEIKGPAFIYIRIKKGSIANPARPDVKPFDVARRFRNHYIRHLEGAME